MRKTTSNNKPAEILSPALTASIERGLAQIQRGEVSNHKDVMKRIRKKFSHVFNT